MAVIQIMSREFQEKQASMFALIDNGEQIVIRRRRKVSYMLIPIYEEDFVLSQSLKRGSKKVADNTGKARSRPTPQRRNLINSWKHCEPI